MKLSNLWRLPTPIEAGKANTNNLLSRDWNEDTDEYTWEDYKVDMKKEYPIRYFLNHTLENFYFSWVLYPINETIYYIRSHIQSSRRYHMLSLRDDTTGYRWGWNDRCNTLLIAPFNILKDFIEKENPPSKNINENDPWFSSLDDSEKNIYREHAALYRWWVVERKEELAKRDRMSSEWYAAHQSKDRELEKELRQLMSEYDAWADAKEQEMLHRLVDIRRTLWT